MSEIDPIALTQALVRCPSVTPADAGALDVVQSALQGLGFTCHRLRFEEPGFAAVDNLYARLGTAGPNFCFAGHTDVVPPGDPALWRFDPFAATIADGRLYGRGAADMKSAVAAFIASAARFLDRTGPGFGGSISLLITGDEEAEAVNGTVKVLHWLQERGERLDACVVGEPTSVETLGDTIKIGRRGSLNGWLTVYGTQGHTAYGHLADNPLPRLVRILAALTAAPLDAGTPGFEPSAVEITSIDVGNPASNVIPAQGRAAFNIRFNDLHTGAALQERIRALCDGLGGRYDLRFHLSGESFLTPPGPLTAVVAGAVERVMGRRPALGTGGGTSDARFIKDYGPVIECGPVGRTIHKVDEHIELDDIAKLTEIYAAILKGWFAGRGC